MSEIWKPHVVVAAVVERGGKFLLVEEQTEDGVRLNQPAGHLEPGESLLNAVCRETLEETARTFQAQALLGVYRLAGSDGRPTYLRFAFCGSVSEPQAGRPLDQDILRAVWLSIHEIRASRERHRSALVLRCIEDYLAGSRHPLNMLRDWPE